MAAVRRGHCGPFPEGSGNGPLLLGHASAVEIQPPTGQEGHLSRLPPFGCLEHGVCRDPERVSCVRVLCSAPSCRFRVKAVAHGEIFRGNDSYR